LAKPRFEHVLLFVTFWPHLMAGPIVRFRELDQATITAASVMICQAIRATRDALSEPSIDRRLATIDASATGTARTVAVRYLLRPALYAAALYLFLGFDDQDRQFIYFQF